MARHEALLPFTHDHHHGLAHARRLRAGASGDREGRLDRARRFLAFFQADTLHHFHEEEEHLFPLLIEHAGEPPEVLGRLLVEHVRIHGLIRRLEAEVAAEDVASATLISIADLLERHIRTEEKEAFPLIESLVPEPLLRGMKLTERNRRPVE